MRFAFALALYQLLLPVFFVLSFPGWIVKMMKRGGFGSRLGERAAIYTSPLEWEPCGQVHVHAVSVGETLIALKLLKQWLTVEPDRAFVLATGTATGHAIATEAAIPNLRVTYSPLDLPSMVKRYLDRFEPSQIVLIEGEAWPNLLLACEARNIPIQLVNARLSPRSARRYLKVKDWLRPHFARLDAVATQEKQDGAIWQELGVPEEKIHLAGSIKFDPGSGAVPTRRPLFQEQLDAFGHGRPVALAASTHAGEEAWIAKAIREANPNVLPVIVPRHAERRAEVKAQLEREGFEAILRTDFHAPANPAVGCLVIDTTGELRDWTAHADVVVIGKSFLSTGGQNPAEAIIAHKPLVFGPHMENFEPLAGNLVTSGGCIRAHGQQGVSAAITMALDPETASKLTTAAAGLLSTHEGATSRVVSLLRHGSMNGQ